MKHQSQLPPDRKRLEDWTPKEIFALFESAKKYRGDDRVAHIERSGVSMGTFHRWRREANEGNPVPNATRPKARQHTPEERAQACRQLAARPGQARQVARELGINVATLYAWRKHFVADTQSHKDRLNRIYVQGEGPTKTAAAPDASCPTCAKLVANLREGFEALLGLLATK